MKTKIYTRLLEMQAKKTQLRKVFFFTIEKLQDDPQECFRQIEEYLTKHEDKIEDFYFENYIDEATFAPILVVHVIPKPEWSHGEPNSVWENLLPDDLKDKMTLLKNDIMEILSSYKFEINDKETREHIVGVLENMISKKHNLDVKIMDRTDNAHEDMNTMQFSFFNGKKETVFTVVPNFRNV